MLSNTVSVVHESQGKNFLGRTMILFNISLVSLINLLVCCKKRSFPHALPVSHFQEPAWGCPGPLSSLQAAGCKDLHNAQLPCYAGHADSPSHDGSFCWCLHMQASLIILQSHQSQLSPLTCLQQQPNSFSPRPKGCAWQAGRAYSALLGMPWLASNTQPWGNKALLLMRMPWLDHCQESRPPDPKPPMFPGAAQKPNAVEAQHSRPQAEALEEWAFGSST